MAQATRITVSLIPTAIDLLLYQGDDAYLQLVVVNGDGSDLYLGGYHAKSQIRRTPPEEEIIAELACVITGNTVNLHLDHVDAALLSEPRYSWDCQVTRVDGDVVTTIAYGLVTMTQEVTR